MTTGTHNISKAWSNSKKFQKNFNRISRISRANIMTSGIRNISKVWSTSKKRAITAWSWWSAFYVNLGWISVAYGWRGKYA